MSERQFLKLGGALLTEKSEIEVPRPAVIKRLAGEIARWPGTRAGQLIVAHGSGSYAHAAASATRFIERPSDPMRMAIVAGAARRLNSLVVDALVAAGVPAAAIPGSTLAVCDSGSISVFRSKIVTEMLDVGLVPVLYGDVAPDRVQGGAIASTEMLLESLMAAIPAGRIILATDVGGVYPSDPHQLAGDQPVEPIAVIRPSDADGLTGLGGARDGTADVTGGMGAKVERMLRLVGSYPGLEVHILSGLVPGAVLQALHGIEDAGGTLLQAD